MAFRLDQKKGQKQKVSQSPQLIEAVALNEKSALEIQDKLDLEILTDADLEEAPLELGDDEDGRVNEDVEWDIYIPKDDIGRTEREIRQKDIPPLERVSSEITYDLQSHLMSQLLLGKMNVVQKEIGAYIIGNLNENGYLETTIDELWHGTQRYEIETWRETLKLIQNFDPKGIAAKDLQECLLIQARSKRSENNLVENIIKNQWDNFLNRKCDAIAKSLSVPVYDVHAAFSVVSGFDPRPGQRFNKNIYFNEETSVYNDSVFHIKPDFYIYKNGNGYRIEPEHCYIDAIISEYFHRKFGNGDPWMLRDIAGYLKSRENKRRFIEAIVKRHKNAYSTIKSIVHFQKDFFDSGSKVCLRPLIARDVADEINLNESTVRRIRKNKYVDTPHGIWELEFFFDREGFDTRDGRRIASKGVKELIKKIIESENKAKPCSDRQISDMLRNDHKLKIELRTVRNYREAMGVLNTRLRKWPC
jgi:RNA polymerase sigma-54 factor